MRANHVYATLALLAAAALLSAVRRLGPPPKRATQPFSVQDLVRLERISELAVSPDGKRVAYTVRTTDMDANKGRTSIWVLDTRKRNAPAVRISDLSANSNAAAWSGDGRFVYYLSNRSGTTQVWRAAPGGEPLQVTNLPLDVGSFRVAPTADRLLVSLEVYRDCATWHAPRPAWMPPRTPPRAASCTIGSSCGIGTRGATGAARNSSPSRSTEAGPPTERRSI